MFWHYFILMVQFISLNRLKFLKFNMTPASHKSDNTLGTCNICLSRFCDSVIVSVSFLGAKCHFIRDDITSCLVETWQGHSLKQLAISHNRTVPNEKEKLSLIDMIRRSWPASKQSLRQYRKIFAHLLMNPCNHALPALDRNLLYSFHSISCIGHKNQGICPSLGQILLGW